MRSVFTVVYLLQFSLLISSIFLMITSAFLSKVRALSSFGMTMFHICRLSC